MEHDNVVEITIPTEPVKCELSEKECRSVYRTIRTDMMGKVYL